MNKSEIKLGLVRKIRTAEYEQLDIVVEVKEIIEWNSEEERLEKSEKVREHFLSDFRRGYDSITGSIGVKRSLATGKLNMSDGSIHSANVESDDDEVDIF